GPALAVTATDSTGAVNGGVVAAADGPTSGLALAVANPTRSGAAVRFSVPAAGSVRLVVVDVLGREVAVLAEGERAAGPHTAALPGALAPGAYVVRLTTATGGLTRRATVVR
ncbi:MAG TPA: T9SS type A sorting domain-containing protein, partial [Rubricoccaceae bacterium]